MVKKHWQKLSLLLLYGATNLLSMEAGYKGNVVGHENAPIKIKLLDHLITMIFSCNAPSMVIPMFKLVWIGAQMFNCGRLTLSLAELPFPKWLKCPSLPLDRFMCFWTKKNTRNPFWRNILDVSKLRFVNTCYLPR